jgi:3-oxoacyl-[acyl-carrier-protein] synthase-3
MHAFIRAIEYYLPEDTLSTDELSAMFPEWSVKAIDAKTGIRCRHIASSGECASDLGAAAAAQLFQSGVCRAKDIDFLLFCTQSPDYVLPTTACLLQDRLGIPRSAGAFDYNLGCSGFVYGLGLAEGLIASGQAETILLITADTYSKYIKQSDKSSRTIFGDGAAATLLSGKSDEGPAIGPFVYGTDGRGGNDLIIKNSGARKTVISNSCDADRSEVNGGRGFLFMDGARVFQFAIDTVPETVKILLNKAGMAMDEIDLFIFHQANAYLLAEICRLLRIPREKYYISIDHCANTVSSTIPIALKNAELDGTLQNRQIVMLVGFGVGYSWSAAIVRWSQ